MSMISSFSISTNFALFINFLPYTFLIFTLYLYLLYILFCASIFLVILHSFFSLLTLKPFWQSVVLMTIARFSHSVFIFPCLQSCIPHYYLQITNISSYTEYLLFNVYVETPQGYANISSISKTVTDQSIVTWWLENLLQLTSWIKTPGRRGKLRQILIN